MYILNVIPAVTRVPAPGKVVSPQFYVLVNFQCKDCGEVFSEATPRTVLEIGPRTSPGHYVAQAMLAITSSEKRRHCKVCGDVSVVPLAQASDVEAKLKKQITEKWIEEQVTVLPRVMPGVPAIHDISSADREAQSAPSPVL